MCSDRRIKITKKLETLFGFDELDDENVETESLETEEIIKEVTETKSSVISKETLDTIEKIENALPQVKGLEASDSDLDEFSDLAKEAFNNLMDLGFQVDSRFSAEIFNSASSMLGHAITAKTSKVNKKLKMIDLQLKKAELDRKLSEQSNKKQEISDSTDLGTGQVLDRNELLKIILNSNKDNRI